MAKAKAPRTHVNPAGLPRQLIITARENGGFTIGVGERGDFNRTIHASIAAFSTLDEALEWLRVNMPRPALAVQPEEAKR